MALASFGLIAGILSSTLVGDNPKFPSDGFAAYYYAESSSNATPQETYVIRYGWKLTRSGKVQFPPSYRGDIRNLLISSFGGSRLEWRKPSFRKHWTTSLSRIAEEFPNLESIQLDFEGYRSKDAEEFHRLVCDTYTFLSENVPRLKLNLALFPPFHPDNKGFHDWKFPRKCFHKIFVMMYDYHNPRTSPGRVTDSSWISKNLNEIHTRVPDLPRSDLILGLPLYGYVWNRDGKFVRYIPIRESISKAKHPSWNEWVRKGYQIYPHTDEFNQIWEQKSKDLGYGGVAYWRWGFAEKDLEQ